MKTLKNIIRFMKIDTKISTAIILFFASIGAIWFTSASYPPKYYSSAILLSAILTFTTTALLEIGPRLFVYIDNKSEHGKFIGFFGKACDSGGVTLLFSSRYLTKAANQQPDIWDTFYKPKGHPDAGTEGITLWLPFQDFRGANYVASEIARVTSQTAYYRTDQSIDSLEIDDLDKTIISFGLGFNKFTHTLSNFTRGELFNVKWSKTARDVAEPSKTDNFNLPGIFEDLPPIKEDRDFSLVVRVAIKTPDNKPSRFFFVCAGRTAPGTAAAGYFLANNWKEISRLYKTQNHDLNKVSCAVVIEHWYGHDEKLTPDAARDHDSSAKIALGTGGRAMIKWWPEAEPGAALQ